MPHTSLGALFMTLVLLSGISTNAQHFTPAKFTSESGVEGLTVAGVKEVNVEATHVRLFAVLSESNENAKEAILNLEERKKSATTALIKLGCVPGSINFTSTKLDSWEWNSTQPWQSSYDIALKVPNFEPLNSKAYTSLRVDWEYKANTGGGPQLFLLDLVDQLRTSKVLCGEEERPEDFAGNVFIAFVGRISNDKAQSAFKSAVQDADVQAAEIAKLTARELGKLKSIVPQVADEMKLFTTLSSSLYPAGSNWPNPFAQLPKSPDEVYGSDPARLSRSYKVELHYELK